MASFPSLVRSLVPQKMRTKLRGNPIVNRLLARWYGGLKSLPHPHAPYQFYFDGHRDIGLAVGGLEQTEPAEITFAINLLKQKPVDCVWDIGANVGYWTLLLAGVQPKISKIISYEPDITNLQLLRINREKNQLQNQVEIRPVALSHECGQATFYADPLTGSTGSLEQGADFIGQFYGAKRREVVVEVSTIDHEVETGMPAPGFIKIDVEGHELELLRGANETLKKIRPTLIMEITQHADEIGQLLKGHGYALIEPLTGKPIDCPQFSTVAVPKNHL